MKKFLSLILAMIFFAMPMLSCMTLPVSAVETDTASNTTADAVSHGYVTDGLVSYYAGSGNEGKTYWEDLVGDNDITGLTLNDTNCFTDKGLKVSSTAHTLPVGIKNVLTGNSFTVEIYLSDFVKNTSGFNNILKCGEPFSFFVRNNTDIQYIEFKSISSADENGDGTSGDEGARHKVSILPEEALSDSLLTLTFTAGGKTELYLDGLLISTKDAVSAPLNISQNPAIGEYVDAVYRSMRFYNRALTSEEVMANAAADVARNEYGYVSNGLVSYYEGSGNVGANVWNDLAGDNHITGLTVNDTNYFTENGFKVYNTMQYIPDAITKNVLATSAFTVEIHISDFIPSETADYAHILKHDSDNFSLYVENKADSSKALKFKNVTANGDDWSRPVVTEASSKLQDTLITLTFSADNKTAIYLNGELISSKAPSDGGNLLIDTTKTLYFGNNTSAVYESMRFYNRVLEEKEIMANAITEFAADDTDPEPEPEPEPTPEIPYVSDGLVSYYAGSGNEGKTYWEDLVSDNDITGLTIDANNYFTAEGLKIYNGKKEAHIMPDGIAEVLRGDAFTFEIHISDLADTVDSTYGYNDLLKHGYNNFSFYRQISSNAIYLKNGTGGTANRPTVSDALSKLMDGLVTVTFEAGGKASIYINGVLCGTQNANATAISLPSGYNLYIGYNVDAVYKSMRFYDRVLTSEEIAANARADGFEATFVNVAQPVTNIVGDISAVREVGSADELTAFMSAEIKPATAIFSADASLNVLNDSGTAFTTVSEVIKTLDYSVIPAFYSDDADALMAIAEYLNNNFTDSFIISSSPSAIKAAKSAYPYVGAVIDYTGTYAEKTELTKAECVDLRYELYSNNAAFAILPGKLCTSETVNYLFGLQVGVWASISDTPTDVEIYTAATSGALGVVSDDTDSILTLACSLPENTVTRNALVIAHRGSSDGNIIRNTYESVVYSHQIGARAIEFDVVITGPETDDGSRELIINHDNTTNAAWSADGTTSYTIRETPWSVLQENVTIPSSKGTDTYKLATLESLFRYFAGADDGVRKPESLLVVELKHQSNDDVEDVISMLTALIDEYELYDQVVVITFSTALINELREVAPESPVAYLVTNTSIFDDSAEANIPHLKTLVGASNAVYHASVKSGAVDMGEESVRAAFKRGIFLYNWSGNNYHVPKHLVEGFGGINTDQVHFIGKLPLDITVSGIREDGLVAAGSKLDITALVETYDGSAAEAADYDIRIIEGEEYVADSVNGALTFENANGNVTFAVEYAYTTEDNTANGCPAQTYTVCSDPVTVSVTTEVIFDGGIKMEGFSIRLKEYNGLRGIFSFDRNDNADFEKAGYKLIEYGAIVVPEAKYIADGSMIELDKNNFELLTSGKKIAVWKNGSYEGKILGIEDGIEYFCLAVTKYSANYADNVYYCGYSVYTDPSGETVITYSDYDTPAYKSVNLYQLTLDMYVNGAINASNTDDAAVWNTLLTGVVTLERDVHFSDTYNYTRNEKVDNGDGTTSTVTHDVEVSIKDMEGNDFPDRFVFENVPAIGNGSASETVTITIVNDPKNNEWVAIYRGEGEIPANAWNIRSQLDDTRPINLVTESGTLKTPNPVLLGEYSNKIGTVILDSGITKVNSQAFNYLNFATFVYPETLTEMKSSVFYYCSALDTAYEAKAGGTMQKNENLLIDLSDVDTVATGSLFRNVSFSKGIKICLPVSITSLGEQFHRHDSESKRNTLKIWCGDNEPDNYVIDLTAASNLTEIKAKAVIYAVSITTVMLPDACVAIDSTAFTGCSALTKICQKTYNASVAEYCSANGISYCNLEGKTHTAS